jgi:hypothetical protein
MNYTFFKKFQYIAVQNSENYETYNPDEKDKNV